MDRHIELRPFELPSEDEDGFICFEDLGQENGLRYWWSSHLAYLLNLSPESKEYIKAYKAAQKTITSLDGDVTEHFRKCARETSDGETLDDVKLSRYACYLIVMNGDPSVVRFAEAKDYFARMAQSYGEQIITDPNDIARIKERQRVTDNTKALNSCAKRAGVTDYPRFQNAGYLGLYEIPNYKLAERRGIPKKSLLDHMGRIELAANALRASLTEERLKGEGIVGQQAAEKAHFEVGKDIRGVVIKQVGIKPEDLPVRPAIAEVRKETKKLGRNMTKNDKS